MPDKQDRSSHAPTPRERELQHDRPSVTNRAWGSSDDPGDQSFGKQGQGGYGDFTTPEHVVRKRNDAAGERDLHARADGDGGGATRSDRRLREAVADRLDDDEKLDASQVLVAAEEGVVTLAGEVREAWMKDCATDLARTVAGVREVRNTLRCDDGSSSFGPPGQAVRSDRW